MFINFWYPACLSEELGERPLKVTMLSCNFALFRDESGDAFCLADTCVHRGGSLACKGDQTPGKVVDGNAQCPYHGWQFDRNGDCVRIPSMGQDQTIPNRAKVDAYPVQEKYGIVFVFLGDLPEDERPPILEAEEYDTDGWACNLQTYDLDANFQRSIENAIDPAHNEFVHPTHGYSGKDPNYHVPELELIEEEWGVGFMTQYQSSGTTDAKYKKMRDQATTEAGSGSYGPAMFWTKIHPSPVFHMHQYTYELPIDETRTRVFLVNMRNAGLDDEMGARLRERNIVVAQQDIDVLGDVEPVCTPDSSTDEIMVPADKCIVAYRKHLQGYEDKGWRIDIAALAGARLGNNKVFTIPSPRRRTEKGWVHDTVPLVD